MAIYNEWEQFGDAEFTVNGKTYRNIQAQVQENKEDIEALKENSGTSEEVETRLAALEASTQQNASDIEAAEADITTLQGDKLNKNGSMRMTGSLVIQGGSKPSPQTGCLELYNKGLGTWNTELYITAKNKIIIYSPATNSNAAIVKGVANATANDEAVNLGQLNTAIASVGGEVVPTLQEIISGQVKVIIDGNYRMEFVGSGNVSTTGYGGTAEMNAVADRWISLIENQTGYYPDYLQWISEFGTVEYSCYDYQWNFYITNTSGNYWHTAIYPTYYAI